MQPGTMNHGGRSVRDVWCLSCIKSNSNDFQNNRNQINKCQIYWVPYISDVTDELDSAIG